MTIAGFIALIVFLLVLLITPMCCGCCYFCKCCCFKNKGTKVDESAQQTAGAGGIAATAVLPPQGSPAKLPALAVVNTTGEEIGA